MDLMTSSQKRHSPVCLLIVMLHMGLWTVKPLRIHHINDNCSVCKGRIELEQRLQQSMQ